MKKIIVCLLICVFLKLINSQNPCKTPDGHNANCVKLQQCPHLSKLLTPPLSDENKLFLQKSQCGFYKGEPYVCCGPPKSSGTNLLPKPGVCGTFASDRIFGGKKTEIDEYPWMALIEYTKDNKPSGFHCGGVLINHNYVITAAHCIKAIPRSWTLSGVRLGEWDTSTEVDCKVYSDLSKDCADPPQDIPVSEIIVHEGYGIRNRNQANDIALLRLSRNAIYSDFVKPICLPTSETLRKKIQDGERLTVVGWGRTETTRVSDIKLKLIIKGVSLAKCNEVYNTKRITISSDQICAGGDKGLDSCRGDSGGPLMGIEIVSGAPYWYLVGVVSFGPDPCGKKDWPGVYTKVASYIDWVESKLID